MIIGQHLFTKDGRFVGNAIITDIKHNDGRVLYNLETDFGNVIYGADEEKVRDRWHVKTGLCYEKSIMFSRVDDWRSNRIKLNIYCDR